MEYFDTVIIGGGQAGLALSYSLTEAGIDHVVLERGRLAERWRSERWDSLRLLTPNWMTRLPGLAAATDDPDGFMSKDEVVDLLEAYACSFNAPIRQGATVTEVRSDRGVFTVRTQDDLIEARNVVVATGHCGLPSIPSFARRVDGDIEQLHAARYRSPSALRDGGVLVVGAGASGIQIAAELQASGRQVVLSSGRHARAVRRYRGMDVWWWLERIGSLDDTVDEVGDIEAARRTPSLGLTGFGGGSDIDLGRLSRQGVTIAGRLSELNGRHAEFDHNLDTDIPRADERLRVLLDRFDLAAAREGLDPFIEPPTRPLPVTVRNRLEGWTDLGDTAVNTILWATGYRPSYPWLQVDVTDESGAIVHRRGVTSVDGLYVLGQRFQWRRGSHLIDGVGRDAEFLASQISRRALQIAA